MLQNVQGVAADVATLASVLESVLGEKNRARIEAFLANLSAASSGVKDLVEDLEGSRRKLDTLLVNADGVVTGNEQEINAAVVNLKRSMESVQRHVDSIAYHLEGTSRNMHEFTRQIRENPAIILTGSPQSGRAARSQ
jgi:phospholipid/cholesterol/gamma-HCH transport system substrate-binding protein